LQHGVEPYLDTLGLLERNQIDALGKKSEGECSSRPVIKAVDKEKIGFLGYSLVRENFLKDNILYACGSPESVCRDIKIVKRVTDHVVVSCHWGIEYVDTPSSGVRSLARKFVDSGASLVIGHHPHVVQGIERYKNSLIFYSLGNFLFDFLWSRATRESFIANIFIDKENLDYTITPICIDDNYRVVPMSQNRANQYREYIKRISVFSGKEDRYVTEDENSEYYIKANEIFKKYQKYKAVYILKNILKTDKLFYKYMINKIISHIIK
jgi:poly-gamma-glutamate synthesis protein (capsule biosynthesis protein)